MERKSLNQFKTQQVSAKDAQNIKGGNQVTIFCEWYIGLTGGNTTEQGMNVAIALDSWATSFFYGSNS